MIMMMMMLLMMLCTSCVFLQQILILHNFSREKIVILLHLCENNSQAVIQWDERYDHL